MHDEAPTRVSKGLAKHPIPVMILARLTVSKREQGKGIGKGLLKDAFLSSPLIRILLAIRGWRPSQQRFVCDNECVIPDPVETRLIASLATNLC